jgi:hypothetical protein
MGQMHIDKSGGNALVAKECLNHSQMNTSLQKMGSVRMPQRVAGYILAYIALLEGRFQAVLHGVLGDGKLYYHDGKSHVLGWCRSQYARS